MQERGVNRFLTHTRYPARMRFPHRIAAVAGSREITFAELNAAANRVAHCLRGRGVGPDRLVAVCMERGIGTVAFDDPPQVASELVDHCLIRAVPVTDTEPRYTIARGSAL